MVTEPAAAGGLALFDFDGTLTTADTFVAFVTFAVPRWRFAAGSLLLGPCIFAYRRGWLSGRVMRRLIVLVGFCGRRHGELERAGRRFAEQHLSAVLRSHALERIAHHRERGDRVALVSASLDVYLAPFCELHGLDLLSNRLETARGIATGRYLDGDCSGEGKAKRIRARYELAQFGAIYAYGDTPEDEAMLGLASERYYRWAGLGD